MQVQTLDPGPDDLHRAQRHYNLVVFQTAYSMRECMRHVLYL